MSVQVWIGEKPEHPNERRIILALANGLRRLDGLYLILANFSVGGRTVDMVLIKHDAIFIIELKQCDGKVFGSVNGPWFVENLNGERKRLNPGRKNPYNQVISYFHALTNFLNEHRREFLSSQKAGDIDFRTCKRVVVIAPSIQAGSDIELDWKVELKGLDELPAYLITERSSEITLTDEEMQAIPALLHCTPWHELNTVLEGVSTDPEQVDDPDLLAEQAVATTAHALAEPMPDEPAPDDTAPAGQRLRATLQTTTGRVAAGLALLTLVLLGTLLLRPTRIISLPADQPLAPLTAVSSDPTGAAALAGVAADTGCNWSGYQLVGKRWDSTTQSWTVVSAETPPGSGPDIVIALEEVRTCNGGIQMTWSLQNNSSEPVEFPLQSDNISINDGLGNEYQIADDESQPAAIRAAPGDQARGTTLVPRPLNRSASSLVVRITDKPFGEASFVVPLQE
jgi:hypothetical protein